MIRVTRSPEPPQSLRTTRSYSGKDVRDRLDRDFFGKCYLCEGATGGNFQIDHLRPKESFPDLVQDWANLFPAHGDSCNQRRIQWGKRGVSGPQGRLRNWPEGGLLDCTRDDIEARLLQWFEIAINDIQVHFEPRVASDTPARNTAEELDYIHNDDSKSGARVIRNAIRYQFDIVQRKLNEVMRAHIDGRQDDFIRASAQFKNLVAKKAPYSALIRAAIHEQIPDKLRHWLGFI
ncbi:MAG: hypothetical protein MJE77_05370 [Proteobacteria bacterium]|nr:hypothetical protein [Pseudomonadota bacterium]